MIASNVLRSAWQRHAATITPCTSSDYCGSLAVDARTLCCQMVRRAVRISACLVLKAESSRVLPGHVMIVVMIECL